MKKSFLSLLIAVGLIGSISAQTTTDSNNADVTAGKLDVSEVTKAYYNFIKDLDNIQNSPPSVNSPDNTVTLINAWTTAFTNLGKVIQDFAKKHPEVLTQTTPPPEILQVMSKLALIKTEYAPAMQRLSSLIAQYGSNPKVQEALVKYKASLEAFQ